jgi:hypothetical protein
VSLQVLYEAFSGIHRVLIVPCSGRLDKKLLPARHQ